MKKVNVDPSDVTRRIDRLLREYDTAAPGLDLRGKVLLLCSILRSTRDLYRAVLATSGCPAADARGRILFYMQQNVGQTLDAVELEIVSGISEYGRRIRELRVQCGYQIVTADSVDPDSGLSLRPSQYVLMRLDPDRTAAHRWHIANRVRKMPGSAQSRILAFLTENVGEVVTSAELQYVAKAKEFGRRVRELRTEQGYAVKTVYSGRPDLGQGEYVLESADRRAQPHERKIAPETEREVYQRDGNMCQVCGWTRERWRTDEPRILELHHVVDHVRGGANDAPNLRVVCSRCHDDIHAGRASLAPR